MPFRQIAGHHHLFPLLAAAAARGTLPSSVIFAGPDGVGKRRAAAALAQLLNCASPVPYPRQRADAQSGASDAGAAGAADAMDACGECRSCRRIARGVHADVLLVEPGDSGMIKVDQIREAVERSAYRPFEGRRRVVIVDDADSMLGEAQNAILKTLEEPPAASMFALVTSRPDVLLPTVRSRCQRLRFGRLTAQDVATVLIRDHDYDEAAAHAAAAISDGSVGAALEGGSEEFVGARDAAARLLRAVAGSTDPRRRLDAAKAFTSGGRASDRDELSRRLLSVSTMLRDMSVLRSNGADEWLANADLEPMLKGLLASFDNDRALRAFEAVDRALAGLERNASPKIVADWIAVQL